MLSIAIASCVSAVAVYFGGRYGLGFRPSQYTVQLHIAHNTDPANLVKIAALWLAEVGGFIALCLLAFKRSGAFFKIGLAALAIYAILFFFNGNLWEFAKFLPAYLILIPMGLQVISNQYI